MSADLSRCTVDDRPSPIERYGAHAEDVRGRQLEYAFSKLEHCGALSTEQREAVTDLADAITGEVTSRVSTVMAVRGANERESTDRR